MSNVAIWVIFVVGCMSVMVGTAVLISQGEHRITVLEQENRGLKLRVAKVEGFLCAKYYMACLGKDGE
jgi:hypothetical protein